MARMGSEELSNQLAKQLLIGDGKSGKTHYAAMCAKAGFNVLYFDGEDAKSTIAQMVIDGFLTREEANRIYLIECADTMLGGVKDSKFYDTMVNFATNITFKWNSSEERLAQRGDTGEIWEIKPARLDETCVVVLDAWTGLTESMSTRCAIAHNVDLASATTKEMRPVYQSSGLKATQQLQLIRSLRCHLIVIGHTDEYTHMTKPEGVKAGKLTESEMTVDWTKMIAKSTSKPHSLQMPKYFTDVAWMEFNNTGTKRMLNCRNQPDAISGGHFNDLKSVDEYSFANLVRKVGGKVPDGTQPTEYWLQIIEAGAAAPVDSQVLDGTQMAQVKSPSFASLMKKA